MGRSVFTPLSGDLRVSHWGRPGGVSEVLGRDPEPGMNEAEYWLQTDRLLLKVLAAAQPLSLQVHPERRLAEEGFEREEAAGIPRDSERRSYKDRAAKAELILALTRFEALSGFRPAAAALAAFAELIEVSGLAAHDAAVSFLPLIADDATIGEGFLYLLSEEGRPLVDALLPVVEGRMLPHPVQAWMAELHPGDAGVVASLLLNRVVLQPGEVLAARPGTIHAYLQGTGVELMVDSDNVLRGGLTVKHVDVAELGRALARAAAPPLRLDAVALGGGIEYRLDLDDDALSLVVVRSHAVLPLSRDAIALCLGGRFEARAGGESAALGRGEALRIARVDMVEFAGEGVLYVAR